jgi:glucosamine kinase
VKIVVDLGGTKGDWRLIRPDGHIEAVQTRGFNPTLHSMWDLEQIIKSDLSLHKHTISEVFYYGAGVHGDMIIHSLSVTLKSLLQTDKIEINSDLIAACRATCQYDKGIVSILGTGSSTCLYDGSDVVDKIPSLGYIAGDEGAGSSLGKRILQAYYYREMPKDLKGEFEKLYGFSREELLENIYKRPGANSYLASFANFALNHKEHPFIDTLIRQEFENFVTRHLLKYFQAKQYRCHFVGSIAWFLQDQLKSILENHGLLLGSVIRKPIDDLVYFHNHPIKP